MELLNAPRFSCLSLPPPRTQIIWAGNTARTAEHFLQLVSAHATLALSGLPEHDQCVGWWPAALLVGSVFFSPKRTALSSWVNVRFYHSELLFLHPAPKCCFFSLRQQQLKLFHLKMVGGSGLPFAVQQFSIGRCDCSLPMKYLLVKSQFDYE